MSKNEGEGNKTADRRYNEGAHKTAEIGNLPYPAPHSDQERQEMEDAEQKGKARAKEGDPSGKRDYSKPAK